MQKRGLKNKIYLIFKESKETIRQNGTR